ncbi:hypothetical protein CCUG60884_03803 [Mycobacteroides salmoniphilum]|uniref:Uncharacterized protein n=1 Tax=Mycobacteroides salmoniphilum TaxID=404941 RepID=A0A4R8SQI1_9MYCO|nr:hypothetical protein CCUG60884_03803 [Mycobacteroides salmoniphilum]
MRNVGRAVLPDRTDSGGLHRVLEMLGRNNPVVFGAGGLFEGVQQG